MVEEKQEVIRNPDNSLTDAALSATEHVKDFMDDFLKIWGPEFTPDEMYLIINAQARLDCGIKTITKDGPLTKDDVIEAFCRYYSTHAKREVRVVVRNISEFRNLMRGYKATAEYEYIISDLYVVGTFESTYQEEKIKIL